MCLSIQMTYKNLEMKKVKIVFIIVILFTGANQLVAQDISKSLGLYVFPSKDQDKATQDADEAACFKWAKEQSDYDPMNPIKNVAAEADTSLDGSAVVGAAGGAAAGAAIGAIAGDTGKGAAIGAVVGGLRGRRSRIVGDQVEQQQNTQAAEAKTKELKANYNKAFSACMEGKGYTVK